MKNAASSPITAVVMALLAILALGMGGMQIAEQAVSTAAETPVQIMRVHIDNSEKLPVLFEREVSADADAVWSVQYFKLGESEPVCGGSGASHYSKSEPVSRRYSHAQWTGDPDCDRKLLASAPGDYVSLAVWTWEADGETSETKKMVTFSVQ